ncbi:thiol:disulfide interchange protein [Veronia nyctiphanis]|uniref:Thiol:disulfide interchange protein n=1 Tax=Veronia nyctiphanis TaxID=1278244 RepID=A0A4Q0YMZ6_9GAMM|nr:thiol:disulfide interchange protein DsbA/DsbL [Veronia nyctiphanis]RXJ72166.1 thiol:disulfide interchange protein [Veronia nyctiphanis]
MLKKLIVLFSMAFIAFSAHAERFKAGEDYQVLEMATPLYSDNSPSVTEFFSFYCPHCFRNQALMDALEPKLPENTRIIKQHVSFMGGKMGPELSKALAAAELLKVDDTMIPVIFERIHSQRKPPRSAEEVRQMFLDNGVDAKKFDGVINSFAVNSMVARFDKAFETTGLTGVPAVIVNGKYYLTPKTIKSLDEYVELVDFLLKK